MTLHSKSRLCAAIFRNRKLTKEMAKPKLHEWFKAVSATRMPEMISAMKTLKSKEDEVLNYFTNRSTHAAAESLNSKMKGFRSELWGCVTCLSISFVVLEFSVSIQASPSTDNIGRTASRQRTFNVKLISNTYL